MCYFLSIFLLKMSNIIIITTSIINLKMHLWIIGMWMDQIDFFLGGKSILAS